MFPLSYLPVPPFDEDWQYNEPLGPFITSMQHSHHTSLAPVVTLHPSGPLPPRLLHLSMVPQNPSDYHLTRIPKQDNIYKTREEKDLIIF